MKGLTIALGLRWSYETPFQTKYGQQSQFDPTVKDPASGLMGAIVHRPGQLAKRDLNNFAPRIGLAWNFHPRGCVPVVLRSGAPGHLRHRAQYHVPGIPGDGDAPGAGRRSAARVPPLARAAPFQYAVQPDGSVPFIGTNYSSRSATWWDPKMRMPYVLNWSGGSAVGVRAQLAAGGAVSGAVRRGPDQQLGHQRHSAECVERHQRP